MPLLPRYRLGLTGGAVALALLLAACGGPGTSPLARLAGAPKPGEYGYDINACGGDHGMLEEITETDRGRIRLGPPEMSICP